MKTTSVRLFAAIWFILWGLAAVAQRPNVQPAVQPGQPQGMEGTLGFGEQPFDFSDGFYRSHGIDPNMLLMRVNGNEPRALSVAEAYRPDAAHNNIRIRVVNGGYDAAGSLLYYPEPPAMFDARAFMNTPGGAHARALANQFRAFLFPKKTAPKLCPAPPCRRQDNMFESTMGYLTHNPLALWRLTFVHYTQKALTTSEGQAALAELRARNGTDLDGTPIIRRLTEINDLNAKGFVDVLQRPETAMMAGFPWVV